MFYFRQGSLRRRQCNVVNLKSPARRPLFPESGRYGTVENSEAGFSRTHWTRCTLTLHLRCVHFTGSLKNTRPRTALDISQSPPWSRRRCLTRRFLVLVANDTMCHTRVCVLLNYAVYGRRRFKILLVDYSALHVRSYKGIRYKKWTCACSLLFVAGDMESSCNEQSDTEQTFQ